MWELFVQIFTDTLKNVGRASINLEFQSLKDELTGIFNATEYNVMNVLNGIHEFNDSRGQWYIQIGADNDVNNQHQVSVMDPTATGLCLRSEVKAADLPSLVDAIHNNEGEVYIDETTGNFTEPSSSNAVKLESDQLVLSLTSKLLHCNSLSILTTLSRNLQHLDKTPFNQIKVLHHGYMMVFVRGVFAGILRKHYGNSVGKLKQID